MINGERKLQAIVLRGCSASGKSTWTKDFVANNPNYVEINRDNIRLSLYGREEMFRGDENYVTECQHSAIREAHSLGQNIVISDTNLNTRLANKLITFLTDLGYVITWKDFTDVPLETLLERDSQREFPVGESVIRRQYRKYIMKKEFKEREPYLKPQNQSLPKAVIFDVDGTLTMGPKDRSPFDMTKVSNDEPNLYVFRILDIFLQMSDVTVFIFSGRDDFARKDTLNWIKSYSEEFHSVSLQGRVYLVMRELGNSEGDDTLKHRFFCDYVKDKFHVLAVFDDRQRVVANVWGPKGFGLPLFRVGDPEANF